MIRPVQAGDYAQVALMQNEAYLHQFAVTPDACEARDAALLARHGVQAGRLVAVDGSSVAGLLYAPTATEPLTLRLQFSGDAAWYHALFVHLRLSGVPDAFRQLSSITREDHWPQRHFLDASGFRNAHQSWGAWLPLHEFEAARWEPLEKRWYVNGVDVLHLLPGTAEDAWEGVLALYLAASRDALRNPATTFGPLGREAFVREIAPLGAFMAVKGTRVLAYTAIKPRADGVETTLTATERAHRGRGLATLVKATALQWAREQTPQGTAHSGGNVTNMAMLRVNQRLGYHVEPMWITWLKVLR